MRSLEKFSWQLKGRVSEVVLYCWNRRQVINNWEASTAGLPWAWPHGPSGPYRPYRPRPYASWLVCPLHLASSFLSPIPTLLPLGELCHVLPDNFELRTSSIVDREIILVGRWGANSKVYVVFMDAQTKPHCTNTCIAHYFYQKRSSFFVLKKSVHTDPQACIQDCFIVLAKTPSKLL